jgi:hypothetical protein
MIIFLMIILIAAVIAAVVALRADAKESNDRPLKMPTDPIELASGPKGSSSPPKPSAGPLKIFTPGLVTFATFTGTPVAGFILIALNYRAVGRRLIARQMIIAGAVLTILTTALAIFIPSKSFTSILPIVYTFGMYRGAKKDFDANFAARLKSGEAIKAPAWSAVGIGVACLIVVVAVVLIFSGGIVMRK